MNNVIIKHKTMKQFVIFVAILAAIAATGFFFATNALAAGCAPFLVVSGGTGVCAIKSGFIPFGNGTSAIATSTGLSYSSSANILSTINASTTALSAQTAAIGGTASTTIDTSGNVVIGGNISLFGTNFTGVTGTTNIVGSAGPTFSGTVVATTITLSTALRAGTAATSILTLRATTSAAPTTAAIIFDSSAGGTAGTAESARMTPGNGYWGFGSTSPFANLSIHANPVNFSSIGTILFDIGSSTSSATTTLLTTTNGGQTSACEVAPATSTAITLNFQNLCNQVLLQIGTAGVTITVAGAKAGDTKRIIVVNPGASAGTITWSGVFWLGGTTPTQTTAANGGDIYSCFTTQATSTVATSVKVECAASSGLE